HESLGQVTPGSLYRVSQRRYVQKVKGWNYGAGWVVRKVRSNGQIRWGGQLRFIGEAFCGQQVGLREVGPGRYHVYLGQWLLGQLRDKPPGAIDRVVRVEPGQFPRSKLAKAQLEASDAPVRAGEASPLRVATDGHASRELEGSWPSLARPPERYG